MKVLAAALTLDEASDGQNGDDAAAAPPAPAHSVVEDADSESVGSNLNGGSDANCNSSGEKKPQDGIADNETKWWAGVERSDGTSFANYSEHEATKELALWLVHNNGYREGDQLIRPFFRHQLSCLNPSQTGARSNVNLDFARVGSATTHFWPSEKAWVIAEFQLTDADKGAANLRRLLPKYLSSVLCGFSWNSPKPDATRAFTKCLRVIMDLTSSLPRFLGSPWVWPPQLTEVKDCKVTMPLITAVHQGKFYRPLSRESARELTEDLLKHLKASADADAYWNLKQCIVLAECKNEEEWSQQMAAAENEVMSDLSGSRKKLNESLDAGKDSTEALDEVDRWQQQLLLLRAARKVECFGSSNRSGKAIMVRLQKQTVMQLDI